MYDCFVHLGVEETLKVGGTHIQCNPILGEEHATHLSKMTGFVSTPLYTYYDMSLWIQFPNILMLSQSFTGHVHTQGHHPQNICH